MSTKCDTQCDDMLWCLQRKLCKKDAHPDRLSRSLMALRLELPQAVADSHEAIARAREAALCDETFVLIKAAYEVHDALVRLFRSAAPRATPDENTLYLITQLDNVIAGYRQSLNDINSKALVYADQVGDGLLLGDVRNGFRTLAHMAPAWSGLPETVTTEAGMLNEPSY